jgi:hypothetical protein
MNTLLYTVISVSFVIVMVAVFLNVYSTARRRKGD